MLVPLPLRERELHNSVYIQAGQLEQALKLGQHNH